MDRLSRDFESVGGITTCASVSKTTRELKLPAKRGSCLAGISTSDKQGTTRKMEEENESVSLTEGDNGPRKIFNASGRQKSKVWKVFGFYKKEEKLDRSHAIC